MLDFTLEVRPGVGFAAACRYAVHRHALDGAWDRYLLDLPPALAAGFLLVARYQAAPQFRQGTTSTRDAEPEALLS